MQEGYSPNDTDQLGNTATHLAAANGHERVLDTLIRDGADVRKQNKFKNTPHDVANSGECRGLLRRAEALPAPSAEEVEGMHAKNLQRILEVERVLIEVVGPLEQGQDGRLQKTGGGDDDDGGEGKEEGEDEKGEEKKEVTEGRRGGSGSGSGSGGGGGGGGDGRSGGGGGVEEKGGVNINNNRHSLSEGKDSGSGGGGRTGEGAKGGGEEKGVEGAGGGGGGGGQAAAMAKDGQVEAIREAVAGAEALCICEDLVAAAGLKIEGLLLQHSIEQQAARVAEAGPILTQEAYTTLVNRLMLLLRRAEGNPRIASKLKRHAK
ncbi:unnamed protein product, partial [Laminaria digitata]